MYYRLKRRDVTERKRMELRLVDEIVILREQLFKLQRSKAECQNEILALREACKGVKEIRYMGYEPRLIHDAEPELASAGY